MINEDESGCGRQRAVRLYGYFRSFVIGVVFHIVDLRQRALQMLLGPFGVRDLDEKPEPLLNVRAFDVERVQQNDPTPRPGEQLVQEERSLIRGNMFENVAGDNVIERILENGSSVPEMPFTLGSARQ